MWPLRWLGRNCQPSPYLFRRWGGAGTTRRGGTCSTLSSERIHDGVSGGSEKTPQEEHYYNTFNEHLKELGLWNHPRERKMRELSPAEKLRRHRRSQGLDEDDGLKVSDNDT